MPLNGKYEVNFMFIFFIFILLYIVISTFMVLSDVPISDKSYRNDMYDIEEYEKEKL